MNNNLIEVENLAINYDGKNVIQNINFTVENNDFLVIFGENGSGKSSLMKALLNLKNPNSGKIKFQEGFNRYEIGYLPQTSTIQSDFPASVKEVVLSGFLNKMGIRPFYTKKEKIKAEENMKCVGIYEFKNECYRNLSGGQKQRVLLARALCATGRLILLDEPVTGLDPAATADFYDMILNINKNNIAVIMVSHDVHSSLSVAKHILHIGNKGVVFFGSPTEYEDCCK